MEWRQGYEVWGFQIRGVYQLCTSRWVFHLWFTTPAARHAQEQLKHLERALELRERAVMSREAGAERKAAEAAEHVAGAQLSARAEVR
jgi:hypothetical protein